VSSGRCPVIRRLFPPVFPAGPLVLFPDPVT
jgi:hypothetical protein